MSMVLYFLMGCLPTAQFDVHGDTATMTGAINGRTPARVSDLVDNHPAVTTILMQDVPGSVDDHSNLEASRMIRAAGLRTHVPSDGHIASGGVDFFIAGASRTAEDGARLGVHSWGMGSREGRDFPQDAPEHDLYLEYYQEMGVPADFYWFTLEAAGADDIHYMSRDELDTYGLLTQ